jgi:hypothetical protein
VDTTVIDGVGYERKEQLTYGCDGCAGLDNALVCDSLPECQGIIWIKAEHQPTDDFTHGKAVYETCSFEEAKPSWEGRDYDIVSKPKHYMLFEEQGIEVRDVIEKLVKRIDYSFDTTPTIPPPLFESDYVQMMQYLMRFMDKNGKQDLEKAKWYLDKLIESYDN